MSEAPDSAVPVVGWRLWLLRGDRTEPEMVSPAVTASWRPRTAMTAVCPHGCPRPPGWHCRCGLYATATPRLLLQTFAETRAVLGCVALWGRVVEASGGWRGEHGYPLLVLVPRQDPLEDALERYLSAGAIRSRRARRLAFSRSSLDPRDVDLRALGDRYGVPVRPVDRAAPATPDDGVTLAAAALRDEAARGLAARRFGDARARHRFDRAVEDLVATLERGSDPGSPITA